MEKTDPKRITIKNWPFRVREPNPESKPTELMLLLHGHLGDENVMWILTKPLPDRYWMLAPRAPIETAPNRFSWHKIEKTWPSLDHYRTLSHQLLDRVDTWIQKNQLSFSKINLLGFSQGAVVAYALTLLYPERINKMAALAGFLPRNWQNHPSLPASLANKKIFISHGTHDEIIPIEKAEETAAWLKTKDAQITFCPADTGHKLSADCFNNLGAFFEV